MEQDKKKYDLSKTDRRMIIQLNANPIGIDKIMEKCNLDFRGTELVIKRLIRYGLIEVELYKGKTLFKLSDKGKHIATDEFNKRKTNGNYGAVCYYIDGKEVFNPSKTIEYIKSFLSGYKNEEFLIDPHIDFVVKCLEKSENGKQIIQQGINTIKVLRGGSAYTLRIFLDGSTFKDVPVNRLMGERQGHSHKNDIDKALHVATETCRLPEGCCRYHDKPTFRELVNMFLEESGITHDSIKIMRINGRIDIEDSYLRDKWIEFHHKHAHCVIITKEELFKLRNQNSMLSE